MVTTKINIDLAKKTTAPVVYAMQNDSDSRVVEAHLFVNGLPFDIGEASLSVLFQKPDGKGGWYDKLPDESNAITVKDGNVVSAILAPQVLNVAGVVIAAIRVDFADGGILSTFPFKIFVEKDPAFGGVESNDYFNVSNWAEVNEEISGIKESLSNALVLNENGLFDAGEKDLRVGALEIDPGLETIGVRLDAEVPEPSEGEGRPTGALSFYDSSYDRPVILRNIADGEGDNDAVTVRQLNEAIAGIPNGGGSADVSYFGVPYESAEAVYDISSNRDESLKLYTFRNSAGKYDAVVKGTGAMADYTEENRPYPVEQIARLHIENGVSSIGSYFMYAAFSLHELTFADSKAITHLGAYAFAKTLIDGEYDFSGLTDTVLDKVFLGCAKLGGLTLSKAIKTITGETFRNCFSLQYVKGLTGLTNITGRATFYNCTTLGEFEAVPANVTLEDTVFVHCPNSAVISGTTTPLYKAAWKDIGTDCFVQNMWESEHINAIMATTGDSNTLPVPLYDAQTDVFYTTLELIWMISLYNGNWNVQKASASNAGCAHFSAFHIYNATHPDAQYKTFREFVERAIMPRKIKVTQSLHDKLTNSEYGRKLVETNTGVSYAVGAEISAYDLPHSLTATQTDVGDEGTALWGVFQALGWEMTRYTSAEFVDGKSATKQVLIDELSAGKPVMASIHSSRVDSDYGHAVAVIGYDANTDKFLVIDSSSSLPASNYDVAYWIEYEALFSPEVGAGIKVLNFGEVVNMTDVDNKLNSIMQSLSFRVETGSFTPTEDTGVINLKITPNAKMIVIAADKTPNPTENLPCPVNSFFASTDKSKVTKRAGGLDIEYYYNNRWASSCYEFDNSDGFSADISDYFVVKEGTTYNYTAYYWND